MKFEIELKKAEYQTLTVESDSMEGAVRYAEGFATGFKAYLAAKMDEDGDHVEVRAIACKCELCENPIFSGDVYHEDEDGIYTCDKCANEVSECNAERTGGTSGGASS